MTMYDDAARLLNAHVTDDPELTTLRLGRLRQLRRRLAWRRRLAAIARPVTLPAVLLLGLAGAVSVPLPASAAQVGSGWSERIYTTTPTAAAGTTIAAQKLSAARVAFSGQLNPAALRTPVTIALQTVQGTTTTTVGTVMLRAERVFNTQPASLSSLFAEMGVAARPGTTYRIAVEAGHTTLTSATVTLAR